MRILIAESDLADAILLREFVILSGLDDVETQQANSLAETIASLEESRFDLVMLNLRLSDAHGLGGLARLLDECPNAPPVIVIGGRQDRLETVRSLRAGAQDYLLEGEFEARRFPRLARNAIERHRMLTELRRSQSREEYLSTHDALTALPNRHLFEDRLSQAVAAARRHDHLLAVLAIELTPFDAITDSFGHTAGDSVLRETARRLCGMVRSNNTAAHLSGHRFVVILSDIRRRIDAARVAQQLCQTLAEPHSVAGSEVVVGSNVGIALHPDDGTDGESLLRNAGAALREARPIGRNTHCFYASEMNARASERLEMENGLRRAIDRNELSVYFQPLIEADSGRIAGAEALLRWRRSDGRWVDPEHFMPIAEETGLVCTLGEWVLRNACATLAEWQFAGRPDIALSVNVSPQQFWTTDFTSVVENILLESCVDPSQIVLDVTERCLSRHRDATLASIQALRARGVRVALDDFGSEMSSLGVLRRLPVDSVKLDPLLVHACGGGHRSSVLVSTAIALARGLDLDVVAEGVELPEQRSFLLERGCRLMYGFLWSPPLDPEAFGTLLRQGYVNPDGKR